MREEREILIAELTSAELDQLHGAFKAYTGNLRDFSAWCAYIVQAMPIGSNTRQYLKELGQSQMTGLLELLEDRPATQS